MTLKPGIYAAFDDGWKILRVDQVEAYNDMLQILEKTMFTMGGHAPPKYGEVIGQSKKTKVKYLFKINLYNNNIYMQLGDRKFHQILNIPKAPVPITL